MSIVTPVMPLSPPLPRPGANLGTGNLIGAAKISEKTIELTTCAQFGSVFGTSMVWFGLTQRQERQHGFDAGTDLGGRRHPSSSSSMPTDSSPTRAPTFAPAAARRTTRPSATLSRYRASMLSSRPKPTPEHSPTSSPIGRCTRRAAIASLAPSASETMPTPSRSSSRSLDPPSWPRT